MRRGAWAIVSAITALATAGGTTVDETECYDLNVRARPIEQVPSEVPDCADCFIMRWPWFLDLRVERVLDGPGQRGVLRVLSVQHTWLIPRTGTWPLRRNTLGGFNVISGEVAHPPRCMPGTPPTRPYITPGTGKTLDDLRREGLARYGPAPR